MTEWENRRLENVIGGDAGRGADVPPTNAKSVNDDWREQQIAGMARRPLAREGSQSGHYEMCRSLSAKLARRGTQDRVRQPATAAAVKTWRDDDAWVVVLAGELDLAAAPTLRAELGRAIAEPRSRLIVDLSGLSFIDSSGVHTILDAYEQCRSAGHALTIKPGPPNVQQVFELMYTLDYLPFATSASGVHRPVT